ncbi:hypothetical protein ADUPG1_013676, partial [Aduncisulcus paluster]
MWLKQLPITTLWLSDNPCAEVEEYRAYVIKSLPQLKVLDDKVITEEEKAVIARTDISTPFQLPPAAPTLSPSAVASKVLDKREREVAAVGQLSQDSKYEEMERQKEMERKLREREVREREIRRVERERAAMQAQKDRDEEEKYQLWKREQELKEMQKKREELDRLEKEAELRSHQQKSSERKQYASSFAVTPTPPRRSG